MPLGASVGSLARGSIFFDPEELRRLREQSRAANQGVLDARSGVIGARSAVLPYQQNVINARAATMAPRGAVRAANGAVIGAQEQQLGATRGLINLEQSQNAARQNDVANIRAGAADVNDKNAVAQESLYRNTIDRNVYGRLGVEAPVSIDVPAGQEGQVAPWARATLKTREDLANETAKQNDQDRGFVLNAAKLAVELQGTDVTAASLAAKRAGMTLDQANDLVDMAELEQSRAQIGVTEAGLGEDAAQVDASRAKLNIEDLLGPIEDAGYELYTDPQTGERSVVTPAEANDRAFAESQRTSRDRIPQIYQTQQARERYQNEQHPWAGLPEAAVSEMFQNDPSLGGDPTAMQELIAYFAEKGLPPQQAQYRAGLLIQTAEARREAEAKRREKEAGGGGFALPAPKPRN